MFSDMKNLILGKYHQKSGLKAFKQCNSDKALYHFEKAILYNDCIENFYLYALTLIGQNKHSQAIPYLERIIEQNVEFLLVYVSLAEAYLVVREWDKAEKLLSYLVENNKTNEVIIKYHNIAIDPVLREKYALSKEHFYQAVAHLDKKEYDQSFENIKKAIELDDKNAVYVNFAGLVLYQAKKPKKEVEYYFAKAVTMNPQNERYKKQLHRVKTRYKW